MSSQKITKLINTLDLIAHPEGGYYKETYRSRELVSSIDLPDRFQGSRCFATAIYFLLVKDSFSAFHRIKSDETWHFYEGSPIEIVMIYNDGKLGSAGHVAQFTVPAQTWFGSRVIKGDYGLAGCTVYPGFEFSDFEMASRENLHEKFPMHGKIIQELTRE